MNRRLALLVAAAALCFALFTTYEHVVARGMAYFTEDGSQISFQRGSLEGHSGSPIQYRMLTVWLLDGLMKGLAAVGIPRPIPTSFIVLRVLEDFAVFALAYAYYRRLGLSVPNTFIGMSLLAWGMSYAHHNSGLLFSTYLDVAFYLLAAWLVLVGRYAWLIPLCALAALNRETSGLIPFLLLAWFAARHLETEGRLRVKAGEWLWFGLAIGAWVTVSVALRLAYPGQEVIRPYGIPQGWPLLRFNALRWVTYVQLFAVLSILPVLALSGRRMWPPALRAFAWAIVPVWFVVHAVGAIVAESRLFLVPAALVFVPGALFFAQGSESRERRD